MVYHYSKFTTPGLCHSFPKRGFETASTILVPVHETCSSWSWPCFWWCPNLIHEADTTHQPGKGDVPTPPHFGNCFHLYIAMMTAASLGSQGHTVNMGSFG